MRGDVIKKYFISTVLFLVFLCGIFSCKNNNDVAKLEDVKIIIKASNEIVCCNAYTEMKETEVIASKEARFLGLFDMSGNVYEFLGDKFKDELQRPLMRSGSFYGDLERCEVKYRVQITQLDTFHVSFGFRIAFSL